MLNRTNLLIVVIALLGAAGGFFLGGKLQHTRVSSSQSVLPELRVGDRRIDLALPDSFGNNRQFSEWDGKLLLVNFWATWCSPCREEMPLLQTISQQYSGQGLAVVGVAIDENDAVLEYLKDFPVAYPILLGGDANPDPSLLFGDTRGVLPYSVIIGRDGKLLAQHAGNFSESTLMQWLNPYL